MTSGLRLCSHHQELADTSALVFILMDAGTARVRAGWLFPKPTGALTEVLREAGLQPPPDDLDPS